MPITIFNRLPEERDEDYDNFKMQSKGTGLVMDYTEEETSFKNKPMLSSMKKGKQSDSTADSNKKQRSQWKTKNNNSSADPYANAENELKRRASEANKQKIEEDRRKMRQDIKKNNKKKGNGFDVVFVGVEEEQYIPTSQEIQDLKKPEKIEKTPKIDRPKTPVKAEVSDRRDQNLIGKTEKPKRPKKEWNKNKTPEVMPVKDHSEERKAWSRPAPIPKTPQKEVENFEVVQVDQNEGQANNEYPQIPDNQNYDADYAQYEQDKIDADQLMDSLSKDLYQYERMIYDMKNNLLTELMNENDQDDQDETQEESKGEVDESLKPNQITTLSHSASKDAILKKSEPKIKELPSITEDEEEDREDLDETRPDTPNEVSKEAVNPECKLLH